jgi:hypothetical protein
MLHRIARGSREASLLAFARGRQSIHRSHISPNIVPSLGAALISVGLGACSAATETSEPEPEPLPVVQVDGSTLCGYDTFRYEDGSTGRFPIVYDFEQLNERLQAHPSVAVESGVERVEGCEQADLVRRAWQNYEATLPPNETPPADFAFPAEPIDKIHLGVAVTGAGADQQWEGIVGVRIGSIGPCTGFFITGSHIITAAHCVAANGRQTVNYFAPTLGSKTVSAVVTKNPGYHSGDRSDDNAIIALDNPESWATGRRFRFYIGGTTVGTRLNIYGYGADVYAGTGVGTLRAPQNRSTIRISDHQDGYFRAEMGSVGTARPCQGDSGGPAIKEGILPIVWGVASMFLTAYDDACPHTGEEVIWSKTTMSYNHGFWEDIIGFTCPTFSDEAGLPYKRCF